MRSRILLTVGVLNALAWFAAGARADQAAAPPHNPSRNLAILIFEGVQIIDYTGPYEVFGHVNAAMNLVPFNIYTVAEHREAVTTAMGMSVNPKFSIDDAPKPDILIIPGGAIGAVTKSQRVLDWVKNSAKDAQIVMSVCNGAFILARAGLLDGLAATTTANLIEQLKDSAPSTQVMSNARFVDNGKVITTAGLSSGIDGSLHVIDRLYGRGTAETVALGIEYNWDPNSTYVRAALADKYLPIKLNIESVATTWAPLRRSGGVDHWESEWSVTSDASPSDLLQHVEEALSHSEYFPRARHIIWKKLSETKSATEAKSAWRFADETGKPWRGAISVKPLAAPGDLYVVRVVVRKVLNRM